MKKKTLFPVFILLLLVLAACGGSEPTTPPLTNATPAAPGVSAVTEATVSIANLAFQPRTLVVATGATVTWKNDDVVAHTVTSGEGWFDSGQLAAGESYTHQFDQPGNFQYHCDNHTSMEGAIVVLPGGAVAPTLFEGKSVDATFPGSGATWEANGTVFGATVHAGEGKITVWDLANDQIAAEIETSGPGLFIRSHHDGAYIWADTMFGDPPNRIYVLDKSTFEGVKIVAEGVQTLHPEFTADGQFVYVADWQGNIVRVYNAETLEKVAKVGGVTTPTGIFNTSRRSETTGH